MQIAYVRAKGRLTVPAELRRRYGLRPGTRVNFLERDGQILFLPVTRESIRKFRGFLQLRAGEESAVAEHLADRRAELEKEVC